MDWWFLVGLVIGLAVLGLYWVRLNVKLKQLIQYLKPDLLVLPLSPTSRLRRAIAAYKQSHFALEQELEAFKLLFQVAPIGFLQVDEDNQLLSCNPMVYQLLGIQPYHLEKPRLLLEIVRSYELDALIEQTRQDQQPCQREWVFHPTDSDFAKLVQQQPCRLRGHGFPMADGCVGVFLESREEVSMLAQQRDRWISDVAHELKTPLTSIRLVAETLQMRLEPPTRDWVDRLLHETIRLSSLVQDLLDLNQLQAHSAAHLTLKTIDLTCLIQAAWVSLEPLAREKQIQLEYVGPECLLLQVDEARMHRVLLNLLDNSIKFTPVQQRIRVQVSLTSAEDGLSDRRVHLEVIDAGPGFPESALPYVFERFYRADPSRTRYSSVIKSFPEYVTPTPDRPVQNATGRIQDGKLLQLSSGSGLGLAIVRQIVEAHQGTVTASNHPETGGAWLQVFLPWRSLDQIEE